MNPAGISVERVSFLYDRKVVLADVGFTIGRGEHVAILGRSGTGKSTLLHLLSGLLRPKSGSILVNGEPVHALARKPVLMFQRPALLPWLTARDNVLLPLRLSRSANRTSAQEEKADALIRQLGLSDRAEAYPSSLSGGQQQRVALARALIGEPPVLLLDEPFSALDLETRKALRNDIRKLVTANGTTLITVTHDLQDAAALASRVLVLSETTRKIDEEIVLGKDPVHQMQQHFFDRAQAA